MKFQGDYHTHTVASDGKATVLDMVTAAKDKGLREIAITDHGFGKIFWGLRKKKFEHQIGEIESARAELPTLLGIEGNLMNCRGKIDIKPNVREKLDIVLFGVHVNVRFSLGAMFTFLFPNLLWAFLHFTPRFQRRYNTKLVRRAIENNEIDVWTHPNKYFKIDVIEVAKVCMARGTLIELNGKRIHFRPIDFERMSKLGCKFIINSDAHKPRRVGDFARAEEFLKNCEYDPKTIINLNQTFTEYKNEKLSNPNQDGNKDEKQKKHGFGFFKKRKR